MTPSYAIFIYFVLLSVTQGHSLLIGHRGDKVLFPEHSIASYHGAALLGADYVEPDVVLTQDRVPVCMHDLGLAQTTDIAQHPEFASRRRQLTAILYGKLTTLDDWIVTDFTLAELKSLRLRQAKTGVRLTGYLDHTLQIPTFEEYLDIVLNMSAKLQRNIGIIPEIKHANYHATVFNQSHIVEDLVLDALQRRGLDLHPNLAPVRQRDLTRIIIQSFEPDVVTYLRSRTSVDIMLLVDTDYSWLTRQGLVRAAHIGATILSPWKGILAAGGVRSYLKEAGEPIDEHLIQQQGGFPDANPLEFIQTVHRAGLSIIIYTFYDSHEPTQVQHWYTSRREELGAMFKIGVDGLFVEDVAEAKAIRDEWDLRMNLTKTAW